jgi:ABC-type sugar transport system ATPase subunit
MNLLPARLVPGVQPEGPPPTSGATLGVRPHDISIVPSGAGDLDALVDVVEPRGSELLIYLRLGPAGDGPEVRVITPPDLAVAPDQVVGLRFDRARLQCFDEETGRRTD